jgi:tetraacyldisaccharide-1-P 4'-kinase
VAFADHHDYTAADVARMVSAGRSGELLTTEKDLGKLAGRSGLEHLRALRVTLQVDDGERLLDLLEAA